jgi:hypothetical protein
MTRRSYAALLGWMLAVSACSAGEPSKWTLWYVPNEPKTAVTLSRLCHTFIFANAPEANTFRVVVVRHLQGRLTEDEAYFQAGDNFSGPLDLGPASVHDDSTGYDVNVDVVYRVNSYKAAKARADADCPPPPPRRAVARPSPKPASPQPSHT